MTGLENLGARTRVNATTARTSHSIIDEFSEIAKGCPDSVAVAFGEASITYGALDLYSHLYADILLSKGARTGSRVGIRLERSIEYVVAILSTLKAGCSFVPLELTLPDERVAYICIEAGIDLLVSSGEFVPPDPVSTCPPPDMSVVDDVRGRSWEMGRQGGGNDEAYVIFTSGSTGHPKGVSVPNRNVIRLVESAKDALGFCNGSVWSLFHSFCFDFSIWELFGGLLTGGRVIIIPYWMARNPDAFLDLVVREHISILSQTPTAFKLLTAAKGRHDALFSNGASVEYVVFGGEALATEILRPWMLDPRTASIQFVNMYGITETTVHVTSKLLTEADLHADGAIGRPLPGWQLHVLGDGMERLPPGITGEIFVGGDGVARGYVGRPGLTAEAFVPDPFGTAPGGRLYRSGDYGYANSSGEIFYVGRQDDQLKIRGYRIELMEVERALLDCPSVAAAAVVADRTHEAARIMAYVVPSRQDTSQADIIGELEAKIPAYMWPAAIMLKTHLPMTINGKLDVEALEHEAAAIRRETHDAAPGSAASLSDILQAVWQDALGIQDIGPDGNFFLLGGDSLVGITIVADAGARGVALELRDIFEFPTTGSLAAELGRRDAGAPSEPGLGEIEAILAQVWETFLGSDDIGTDSNFFLLGGDSLVGLGIVAECRLRGLGLELKDIFTYPTIGELALQLGRREGTGGVRAPAVSHAPFSLAAPGAGARFAAMAGVEDAYPLSALQAGMLYHSERDPDSAVYHEMFGIALEGGFDRDTFDAALARLAARHAILRTAFQPDETGQWHQVVHAEARLASEVTDWRALDARSRAAAQARFHEAEKHRPFDWSLAPLLRVQVHLHAERAFNVTFSCHHIILDGWSMASLVTELFRLYAALRDGGAGEAAPLRSTYRDFIAAEAAAAADAASAAFWRDWLEGHEALTLPAGGAGSGAQRIVHKRRSLAPLLADLQQTAAMLGVPLKSVLLAAYVKCLSAVSGRRDIVTGLVSNGRLEVADGEQVLGLFLNSLPFRIALDAESWAGLVRRVFEREQDLIPHRRFPLPAIQRAAGSEQLFDTLFNYVRYHVAQDLGDLPGLRLVDTFVDGSTNFSLVASFALEEADLRLELAYDADLLDDAWIEAFATYLERALACIARAAAAPHHYATLLDEAELDRLLTRWNETGAPYPRDETLPALFARQAAQRPDAIAVTCEDESLTYAELDRRADILAARLARHGIAPEERIGLCAERSLEMIVGMLGILKAGAAYVPLDPDYPQNHLDLIIEDCWSRQDRWTCVCTEGAAARMEAASAQVMLIPSPGAETQQAAAPAVNADQLAYVIYTSGSTGRPKGVMVPHRGILNLAHAQNRLFRLDGEGRVLQFASLCFDASVSEIATAFAAGATLIVAPRRGGEVVDEVAALLRRHRVSHWTAPPSLLATLDPAQFPALACVVSAGESCPYRLAQQWSQGRVFINAYGPTETTVCASMSDDVLRDGIVSIGTPIAGATAYLLDEWGILCVPTAAPAELHVGGVGLARGYANDPKLTAERFVPDPFGTNGHRLYRTGDLAGRSASGALEYHGRIDRQLKIRGHRIEPSEIENALRSHPGIRSAAVALIDGHLTAVAVPENGSAPTLEEIRRWLQLQLPPFMQPARILSAKSLPVTSSGKIDPGRLAEGAEEMDGISEEKPATAAEVQLAQIWCEILGLPEIGVETSFFSIGGDSLLAVKLAARTRALWPAFKLRDLFEFPTIRQIAAKLSGTIAEAPAAAPAAAIEPDPARDFDPFPVTEIQRAYLIGRSGAFALGDVGTHGYSEYRARHIDLPRLEAGWNRLVERHPMLRTVLDEAGASQRTLPSAPAYRIRVDDLRTADAAAQHAFVESVRAEMSAHVFDPGRWPLFDVRVSILAEDDWRLHVTIDGLIMDAHSYMLILEEWGTLYRDPEVDLGGISLRFQDYVRHLSAQRESAAYQESRAYWRARAQDFPDAPRLPLAHGGTAPARSRFVRRSGGIDEAKWTQAKRLLKAINVTPTILLLTCYAYVLQRWSGQRHFGLNLTLFDRPSIHPDISKLVGDFTSLLLLEVKIDPGLPFQENAINLQRQLWADMDHSSFGGLEFMRELRSARSDRAVAMPFVFSSALSTHFGTKERRTILDETGARTENELTQTSQVLLDHMAAEDKGALVFNWDAVEDAFLDGVLDGMFAAYVTLLDAFCSGALAVDAPYQFPSRRRHEQGLAASPETLIS
jgi:amino acid adenylation domain-containing protein